jgi:hypothetical protein
MTEPWVYRQRYIQTEDIGDDHVRAYRDLIRWCYLTAAVNPAAVVKVECWT